MIHVFNGTGSALGLLVNGGSVAAPEPTGVDDDYRPYSRLVELRKFCEPSVFCPGSNLVDVAFHDFKPPLPSSARYRLVVPQGASIQSDFVLFLFADGAILMRPSGEIVDNCFDPGASSASSLRATAIKGVE
jgi:hypothetical protein